MWPGKTRAIDYNPTAAFPFLSSHSFTLLALLSRVIYSKSLSPSLSLSRFYSPSPLPPKYRFVLHYSHLSILPYLSPFFRFLYTKRLQKKNVEWAFCCYFSSQMPDLHIPWLKCACLCFSTPHYIMCHNTQKKNKSLSWGVFFFLHCWMAVSCHLPLERSIWWSLHSNRIFIIPHNKRGPVFQSLWFQLKNNELKSPRLCRPAGARACVGVFSMV